MTITSPALARQPAFPAGRVRRWIVEHEQSRLWVISFFALALLLGSFVGTFWLVTVVVVHAALELVRQRYIDSAPGGVLARTAWELKLDVARS